ncbi:hypothetical protein PIB30_043440 [Stylosanthes scabra]|uniref:Uncharacterized protein n=1 Tax=Stylosanthes scabra TaxID=79078 RepID=A0ABU6VIE4_9FABA|nr:hypothetical protein [Stylosanthes scabra]
MDEFSTCNHHREDVDKETRIEVSTGNSFIFPTNSTISSATSRSKRHCDLPHEDDHSDGPRPRSPCMRVIAYRHLFARGASSQEVIRQTDRVRSVPESPVRIHRSVSNMLRSSVSNSEEPTGVRQLF